MPSDDAIVVNVGFKQFMIQQLRTDAATNPL